MDEARLSPHEQRVLAEIEADLNADARLARRMAGRPPAPRSPRIKGRRGAGAALLAIVTLTLLVLAAATSAPALIWAFAAAWVATLILLLRAVVRWTRRRSADGPPDR
ncbi:DUF3040 domain-containing protein [Streptomyces roseolus]|uniref:DUF3040 domain-containing protein n=1 Tax=Streptomyces roseolus TaxID=67358 RepID=UPI00167C3C26|nr:DUF3040 domain-containing protein [Streptomyces roseolus]GGR63638.1 hypothetical protein GCM10010282_65820 [Streptomyces roseolus]